MMLSHSKFAKLLFEGIELIRVQTNQSMGHIQDQLAWAVGRAGRSAVEYWRKGISIPDSQSVEVLAREIIPKANRYLGRQWLYEFLLSGNYNGDIEALCNELCPKQDLESAVHIIHNLPQIANLSLIGREEIVSQCITWLTDGGTFSFVGIDGQGGIGKTAIALEIGYQCYKQQLFEAIIWIQAEKLQFATQTLIGQTMTVQTILNMVGSLLIGENFFELDDKQKITHITLLFSQKNILLILDNMETANEPQQTIIATLQPILGKSKALLTSRQRFKGDVHLIHLSGLDDKSSVNFIRRDGESKGIFHLKDEPSNELLPIVQLTGGSPFAMKLVVGQLMYLKRDIVLKNLTQATPIKKIDSDGEYTEFYRYIFLGSWQLLQRNCQELLVGLARFNPQSGCDFETLQQLTQMDMALLSSCIDNLYELSFLETNFIHGINQLRYYRPTFGIRVKKTHFFTLLRTLCRVEVAPVSPPYRADTLQTA